MPVTTVAGNKGCRERDRIYPFEGNMPVGMAYIGDIKPSKKKKDDVKCWKL